MRTEVRTGMTVKVRARGPFILPAIAGPGPWPFIDLEIPGGGWRRMAFADNGQELGSAGTGNNSLPYIDLKKPDNSVARILVLSNGQRGIGVGTDPTLSYIDFKTPDESVWRLEVLNSGQTQVTKQS